MATTKGVVVKVGEESFLTSYGCGETIDGLLGRVNQSLGISKETSRLFVLDQINTIPSSTLPKQPEITLNFHEDLNSQIPWISSLFLEIDSIILYLRPTIKSLMARKVVLEYMKKNLSKCLGARVFCIGSSMNNIFLPHETIEVTPFLCKGQEDKWFLRVNEGLCSTAMANGGEDANVHVRSITFNCANANILVDINQLTVKVCHNELVSLYSGALLEDLNHNFGRKSMIKKSLLLIKSWCSYDSSQYSAVGKSLFPDILPAKVLHLMVLHIFCRYGTLISHPLVALSIFLFYYSNINWNSIIINIESTMSTTNLEVLTDKDLFPNSTSLKEFENVNAEEIHQIRALIINYRLRYQSTLWACTRAKEDDTVENFGDPTPRESSISERESDDRLFDLNAASYNSGRHSAAAAAVVAWGISSDCPSLTNEFQPPPGLPFEADMWSQKKMNAEPTFNVSFMNISDSIRPHVNLTENMTEADVAHITSILSCGYQRLTSVWQRCKEHFDRQAEVINLGMGVEMSLVDYFLSEVMGMSRDVANLQKSSSFSSDDAANIDELKSSKYFCESEGPESVMRHAELIMGSKITADAVAHLIVHIVEQAGPHPIGEIGKLLQEATGNPNLSRVLKSQFRGLKKLIEGYPHMLRLGGDHSFNPHVYLAEKSSNSGHSEIACTDALMEAITDRDSDDPISPPGSQSQLMKKHHSYPSMLGVQSNGRPLNMNPIATTTSSSSTSSLLSSSSSMSSEMQHQLQIPQYQQQYQQHYRPDISSSSKHRMSPSTASWQTQSQGNLYSTPTNPSRAIPNNGRLHPEANEYDPTRGMIDYSNSTMKQRSDGYRMVDINRNQQLPPPPPPGITQQYGYRTKQQQQQQQLQQQNHQQQHQQQYDSSQYLFTGSNVAPRSQNIPVYPTRPPPQQNRTSAGQQPSIRYDLQGENNSFTDTSNRSIAYGISRGYSNPTLYPSGRDSWERNSLTQFDSELSFSGNSMNSGSNTPTTRLSQGGLRPFPLYEMENNKSRPNSLGNGRLSYTDPSEAGLEFETDRQSFLLPNDYDPGNHSYSISDYDLLRDAAFAQTNPSVSLLSFGHDDVHYSNSNSNPLLSNRDGEREVSHDSSVGDSKMLAYFLRESER